MTWKINFTKKAAKQALELPERVIEVLEVLIDNLKTKGPAPGKKLA